MSRVIAPSRYLARIVEGWGVSRSKISIVYNASDAVRLSADGAAVKKVDLVTVARLVPWKGIAELCVIAARNRWTLRVVGDGPLRAQLEAQVEAMGARDLVSFLGHIPKDMVREAIAEARVFVLNSTYEGLPHVILEAKAAGLPVVATAAGGTPETIRDGYDGYLVPPEDSRALERRLELLLTNGPLREQLGQRARQSVNGTFSIEFMVAATEAALVNGSGRKDVP